MSPGRFESLRHLLFKTFESIGVTGRLINSVRRTCTLPLLARELTEAAARRRTYIVRAVYASFLFILALVYSRNVLFASGDRFNVLGRGDELFLTVVLTQFAGIYLFLPAMTCAAITSEKERNTLGLLFLTRLSPAKIIVEKFLGRVFPMVSLLLLSLPLFGIAYTLGGLESSLIWEAIVRLLATTLMIGAIGIAASAWCRTTAGAFFATYAILLVLFPGPIFLMMLLGFNPSDPIMDILNAPFAKMQLVAAPGSEGFLTLFFGPGFPLLIANSNAPPGITSTILGRSPVLILWQTTPIFFVALCALAAARVVLVVRAEAKPKRYIIRLFRWIDQRFRSANDRYAHGIEIIKTRGAELGNDPVAWRETTKTALGAFRYLVRILLVIEVPILIYCLLSVGEQGNDATVFFRGFAIFGWLGACLLIAVKGASLFPLERSRESLGVLLTTAMPTREIVRQKLTGLWRLIAICCIPMITLFGMILYMANWMTSNSWSEILVCGLAMVCVMATTFPMVGYTSVAIGLRTNRASRAVLSSVCLFVAFCLTGPILYLVLAQGDVDDILATDSPYSLYSPLSTLAEVTLVPLNANKSVGMILGTLLIHGGLALVFRNLCYRNAAEWLGRGDELTPPKIGRVHGELYRQQLASREVAG